VGWTWPQWDHGKLKVQCITLGRNYAHIKQEDYCDAPAKCSQDNQIFKGIYFHHLDLFCEPLPTSTPLIAGLTEVASSSLAAEHAGKCASYTPWIEHNAYAALSTRNGTGVIGGWWGASYVNKTQGPWPGYAAPKPYGSTDEWNEPWVLQQPGWECQGWHCQKGGRGSHANDQRMAKLFRQRRGLLRRRDVNDEGRGRTVETQGSGVGVVKAASDFTRKRLAA